MQSARAKSDDEPSNWHEIESALREQSDLGSLASYFLSENEKMRMKARVALASAWSEVAARRRFPEWSARGKPGPALWEYRRTERYINENIVRPWRELFGRKRVDYSDPNNEQFTDNELEIRNLITEIAEETGLDGTSVVNALNDKRRSLNEYREREKQRKAIPVDLRTPEGREEFRRRGTWRRPIHKVYENLRWKYQLTSLLKKLRELHDQWSNGVIDKKPAEPAELVQRLLSFSVHLWKTAGFSLGLRGNLDKIEEIIAALSDARPLVERRVKLLIVESEDRVFQAAPDFVELLLDDSVDLSADTGRLLAELCSRCRLGRYSSVARA